MEIVLWTEGMSQQCGWEIVLQVFLCAMISGHQDFDGICPRSFRVIFFRSVLIFSRIGNTPAHKLT